MKTFENQYVVRLATPNDFKYLEEISAEMSLSAKQRKTGIAQRNANYLFDKVQNELAFIIVNKLNEEWIAFCYLEVWKHQQFIANSGLIIAPKYRGLGFSRIIKGAIFDYCNLHYPAATLFSLTMNKAVIQVNKELGYKEVPISSLLSNQLFMEGRDSWVDYVELMKKNNNELNYVAMVYHLNTIEFFAQEEEFFQLQRAV